MKTQSASKQSCGVFGRTKDWDYLTIQQGKEVKRFNIYVYCIVVFTFQFFRNNIEINKRIAPSIWRPAITFENVIDSKLAKVYGATDTFFFQFTGMKDGKNEGLAYGEQFQSKFACYFKFNTFPFDSHQCRIEFGELLYETKLLKMSATQVLKNGYRISGPNDDPIIINNLPFPYEFQLKSLLPFEVNFGTEIWPANYSYTGCLITLERKSINYLMVGYYYPTTAFALLSMISYLIDADIVRILIH